MKLPKKVVVDTNVPLTANKTTAMNDEDMEDDAYINCVQKCIEAIETVIAGKCPVLDDGGEIFEEYSHKLSFSGGQPGVGDRFFKWIHDHQWDETKVERVAIPHSDGEYKHFPKHDDLKDFDPSDRKFVAVANAHADKPPILQAVDFMWWKFRSPLREAGITVRFLAPEYARTMYKKNFGAK